MKARFYVLIAFCLLITMVGCKSTSSPEPPAPEANIVLDGGLTKSMTTYGCPKFEGYVKNIGNATGYNCGVEITCYSDAAKTTIIDTANGFPANLGNIPPNTRALFDATAFECNSHDQIKAYDVSITWLTRDE